MHAVPPPSRQVLAILALLCRFRRVLYVDIDVHHGDAVEVSMSGLLGWWWLPRWLGAVILMCTMGMQCR